MAHLVSIMSVLWLVPTHRRLIVISYALLVLEAAIAAAMPTLVGGAVRDCLAGGAVGLAVMVGGGAVWAAVYGVRAVVDTHAFEGALTEALIVHLQRTRPTAAEASATIKAAGLITVVLRYKLPRLVAASSLVAGALVFTYTVDWRLTALVAAYLACQAWPIAALSAVAERVGRLRNRLFDALPAAVEAGGDRAAVVLRRIQALEVTISNLDARISALQSAATTAVTAAAIAAAVYVGADAAAVTALVVYFGGLGRAANAAGVVAQLAGEASDAAERIRR